MTEPVLVSSTSARLEPYLLLAKNAKGAAAVQLITDVLNAQGVYVFSELLEMSSVLDLANNPAHAPHLNLLRLFAYGTYRDYRANAASLPALSDTQLRKLKHLTIVTLSGDNRTLNYDLLLKYLDIPNVRELEDLIIDAIYQDLIRGKLDQSKKCLEVEFAMGRDLRPEQATQIMALLSAWCRTSETILTTIDANIAHISKVTAEEAKRKEEHSKSVEQKKWDVQEKVHGKHNKTPSSGGPIDALLGEDGGRRRGLKGRLNNPSRR
ncbi:uncharacterized protein EV422DRAFT_501661 [Fimicolochytrium jonesii]|uniref:uncharacterized protein n=1 Tax=Fimicolochytrium jonesii TaxID=1396493 RepID=UPI0022FDFABF|nr:uncharacterized protein EV422DRAFT_501661 [Fimicolochytrium jonesii]KAI8816070.1 hypothetical protein EV422DRAFT_501661 [Fimicolochytrium jonesii]